ncbi:MAG: hypothetical protein ACI841_004306, partial [Planctomycetota bacterium]
HERGRVMQSITGPRERGYPSSFPGIAPLAKHDTS